MCLSKQNGLGCNLLTSAIITCCHLNLCDLDNRSCSELAAFCLYPLFWTFVYVSDTLCFRNG